MCDAEQIRKLIARYAQAIDDARYDDLASLFAEDAEWVTPEGSVRGPQGVRDFMSAYRRRGAASDTKTKHLATNSVIDIDGDTATALSDFIVVRSGPADGGTVVRAGRYEDAFTKQDGEWRFAKRVHHSSAWRPDMAMAGDEQ